MNKFFISLLLLCLSFTGSAQATLAKRGFAIVVDPKSYAEARTEIDEYARAIETL